MSKKRKQPTISESLRTAIRESGETMYRIAIETETEQASLGRFMRGETSLRLDLADRIATYLGLELVEQKGR